MKPSTSKKKNVQKKSSSDVKIDHYFQTASKQLNLEVKIEDAPSEKAVKAIYIEALKKKLQDLVDGGESSKRDDAIIIDLNGENDGAAGPSIAQTPASVDEGTIAIAESCETEMGSQLPTLPNQCSVCKDWEVKYNDLKKLCLKLTIRNADMDLKYEDLLKAKTASIPLRVSGDDQLPIGGFFTQRELKYLECMSLEKKMDSTFVHHCLQFAYKGDQSALLHKTLKGKAEVRHISDEGEVEHVSEGKDPLTPTKVESIRSLFIERISKCQLDAVAYGERIKDTYLNKLIASGIRNISKKK